MGTASKTVNLALQGGGAHGAFTWGIFDRLSQNHSIERSPAFMFFDMMTRLLSPYQFNPLNYNPLRDVLEKTIDFERLRSQNIVKLFLCATNVRTGKVRI